MARNAAVCLFIAWIFLSKRQGSWRDLDLFPPLEKLKEPGSVVVGRVGKHLFVAHCRVGRILPFVAVVNTVDDKYSSATSAKRKC